MRKSIAKMVYLVMAACLIFTSLPLDRTHAASTINVAGFNSTAIQNAINLAVAGDTVYFPNGTYNITTAIIPKSGIKLIGQAQATAIIKYTGTTDDVMVKLYDATKISNVEISNLTFEGNNNVHARQGIEAMNGSGHWIHDNTFKNFVGTGDRSQWGPIAITIHDDQEHQIPGVSNSRIEDNTFANIGVNTDWGAAIRFDGSNNLQVFRNTISDTGRGGINGGRSTNAIIRGNTVTGGGHASTPDNLLGLSIELISGCDNSIIEDNIVDHWISLDNTNYVSIRRNTISSTVAPYSNGIELAKASYVVTTDNMINGGQAVGFSITSGSSPADGYNYIGYNTVKFMKQWGLQFQGANGADVQNQYFYKNHFLNTYAHDPNAPYPGAAGHGFRTNGYTKNVTLNSNEISGNEDLGIEFNDTPGAESFSIINNTITSNGGASINQYPSAASNLEWSGNTVSGNGTNTQLSTRGFSGTSKPIANFTSVTTAQVGQPVTFTNTSTNSIGSIVKSLWDFGDGIPSTTTSPTYTYTAAGTYRVTLVVWNNAGRAELKQQNIVVTAGTSSKFTGTAFGTTGTWNPPSDTFDKVFDGNTATFFDSITATGAYAGIDLGSGNAKKVTSIKFYPRAGQEVRMVGGKFQGSNTSSSSGFTDLYTITSQPPSGWNEVTISDNTTYRYLRYIGGTNSYGNVSEVEFYSSGTPTSSKLTGTAFGTTGTWNPPSDTFDKVFDGDTATFFDSKTATGAYVGIDLGSGNAKKVTSIKFYPRAGQEVRMVGGKFQGSNTSSSSGFTDLYTITSQPPLSWNEVTISDNTTYRYLRYIGGTNSYGNVSEVEFWGQ